MLDNNWVRVSRAMVAVGVAISLGGCGAGDDASADGRSPVVTLATGKQLYARHCKRCHQKAGHTGLRLGPALDGIMGRKAASVTDFAYSPALKSAEITWTRETISSLIQHPQRLVPGIQMAPVVLDKNSIQRLVDHIETL